MRVKKDHLSHEESIEKFKIRREATLREGFKNAPRCGAKTKHGVGTCQNIPIKGRIRCRFHGGTNTGRIGIASSRFKTGKTSKYLPDRLISQFKNSKVDQNLLELRYEVALVDARIVELTSELDKKGNVVHFKDIKRSVKKLKREVAKGADPNALILVLDSIEDSLNAEVKNSAVWKDIGEQIDRRLRLTESERKRLIDGHHMISVERMMMLVANILKIILENVPDMQARHKIRSSLLTLLPSQTLTVKTKQSDTDEVKWLKNGELPENASAKEDRAVI